jgi:hypothetical protein
LGRRAISQAATVGAHRTWTACSAISRSRLIAAGQQHLVVGEVLAEDDLGQRVIEPRRAKRCAGASTLSATPGDHTTHIL